MRIIFYRNKIINDLIYMFFLLFFILLPYDAIRIIPAIYKPVSLIPLVFLFFLLVPKILEQKLDKPSKYLLIFYVLSNFWSVVNAMMKGTYSFFLDYFITSSIGIIIYLVCNLFFKMRKRSQSNENYIIGFCKIIAYAYYFPIIIAFLDALYIYNILPSIVGQYIRLIFGGNQDIRICGFTFEASWLAMHLLFSLISFVYLIKKKINVKFNYFFVILNIVIFLLTFSMQGYINLIVAILLYWAIKMKKNMTLRDIFSIVIFVLFIFLFVQIVSTINSNVYFIARFKNLSLSYLLRNDASAYVRVLNPTIGVLMGFNNFLLGVGGGHYPLYYGDYVTRFFPWGKDFYGGNNEIVNTIDALSANAKALYARVIAESGVISILFFLFIKSICKRRKTNKYIFFWLLIVLSLMLQFDSMCYFPFFVFLAFYRNLESSKREVELSCRIENNNELVTSYCIYEN